MKKPYDNLPEYAKRMVDEEAALCVKIDRLDKFLLSDNALDIDYAYYHLMVAQLEAMQTYRRILHVRIHIELEKANKEGEQK